MKRGMDGGKAKSFEVRHRTGRPIATLRIHPSMVSKRLLKFPQREKEKRRQREQKKASIEDHSEKSAITYPNPVPRHPVTLAGTQLAFL